MVHVEISANRLACLLAKAYNSIYFCLEDLGFRVWGLGFRVQGLGFRVQGSGFRV